MSDAAEPKPAKVARKTGLGRGLSALLGEIEAEAPVSPAHDPGMPRGSVAEAAGIRLVGVAELRPHPGQPRRHFDDNAIQELARSIAARGLLQPIIVRPHAGHLQIVAGERRWRAAQVAGIHQVPVIVREIPDEQVLEIALLENIQRQDLNAIEEAEAYQRLIVEYGHTQETLGQLVHKSRSHVANLLRLLELPGAVREAVADGRLSMGHARALVTAKDAEALMARVLTRGLSVRQTEALARQAKAPAVRARGGKGKDPDLAALERQLGDLLGLGVRIAHGPKGGSVTLDYSTLDQLDLICQRLSGGGI